MPTVEEIKNALVESNKVTHMPIPQFHGKKGEKPEDHIMKVEDYFQNYKIENEEEKCNTFRDTWHSTLTDYPKIFDPDKAPYDEAILKTMKNSFFSRW